jgi:hypothetical protein
MTWIQIRNNFLSWIRIRLGQCGSETLTLNVLIDRVKEKLLLGTGTDLI